MRSQNVQLSPLYDVVRTSIYLITNSKTGHAKVENTLALNFKKSKSYPPEKDLIKFGQQVCLVQNAQQILEKIEDAKRTVLSLHSSRMNSDLIQKIKKAWRVI